MAAAVANTYGGQALIEGVMIRSPLVTAMAVRSPDGTIVVRSEAAESPAAAWRTIPFVRGIIGLYDALRFGVRSLSWSASVAGKREGTSLTPPERVTTAVALLAAAAVFVAGPVLATSWIEGTRAPAYAPSVAEGALRILMFIGYVAFVGRLPEVRRVFQYHGAEHRAVHAYEHGGPLTVDALRRFPDAHPRCGTAFLVTVGVLSMVVFVALGSPPLWVRVLERVVLLPLVAGWAYEFLRLSQSLGDTTLMRVLGWPNLALQRLTTRTPDDAQLEVAIAAMREAITFGALLDEPVSSAVRHAMVEVEVLQDDDR